MAAVAQAQEARRQNLGRATASSYTHSESAVPKIDGSVGNSPACCAHIGDYVFFPGGRTTFFWRNIVPHSGCAACPQVGMFYRVSPPR